jgi:RNA-splicing ligase RtcB
VISADQGDQEHFIGLLSSTESKPIRYFVPSGLDRQKIIQEVRRAVAEYAAERLQSEWEAIGLAENNGEKIRKRYREQGIEIGKDPETSRQLRAGVKVLHQMAGERKHRIEQEAIMYASIEIALECLENAQPKDRKQFIPVARAAIEAFHRAHPNVPVEEQLREMLGEFTQ